MDETKVEVDLSEYEALIENSLKLEQYRTLCKRWNITFVTDIIECNVPEEKEVQV